MAQFLDFLFGKSAKTKTKPIYNPQQRNVLDQLLGGLQAQLPQGLQNLQNILGGDEATFKAFEAPARRGFEQQTLPTIAERFTGQFGTGSQQSSAFGQALGQAGKELEENLFSKRIGMQGDALQTLLQLLSPATSPRNYQYTRPRQPGFLENFGLGATQGLSQGAGQFGSLLGISKLAPLLGLL